MGSKLNDVERMFVNRITAGDAAGLAYARARTGDRRGRSDVKPTKSDYSMGSKWLKREEIVAAIENRRRKTENLDLWSKEKFLQYLEGVMTADPRELGDGTARFAQGYVCSDRGTHLTMTSKLGAAQLYAKCRGFEAPQKVEQEVSIGATGDLLGELGLSKPGSLPGDVMPL